MNQFLCCNKLLARNGDDPRKLLIVSRNAPKYPRVLLRSFLFDQFSLLLFLFKTGRKSLLEETRENENNNKMKTEDNTIFRRKFCFFSFFYLVTCHRLSNVRELFLSIFSRSSSHTINER